MLYIYVSEVTKRLEYTLDFIFNGVLRVEYELTTERESCLYSHQPFINYSESAFGSGLWIPSMGLLNEKGIRSFSPKIGQWDSLPSLFPSADGDIPFDLFSGVFYLISRYEEYDSTALDKHKRYEFSDSIAFRNNFLQQPLVDEWLMKLKDLFLAKYPHLKVSTPKYKSVSTIDIDHVYRYLGKSKWLMFTKLMKLLVKLDFQEAKRMIRVLTYLENDPYLQFANLDRLHRGLACKYIIFIHCGSIGKYDRKTIYPLITFNNYLRQQNHLHIIGLHPSYRASFDKLRVETEKKRLEKYLHYPITYSRHHYLRVRVPESYRMLEQLSIQDEYSMGYAGMYGFRASTCHPFRFFDINRNEVAKLKIHPTLFMDGSLRFYQSKSPDEALQVGQSLVDKCRAVNGEFVMLWHNNSVAGMYEWEGWSPVFEKLLVYSSRTIDV